LPCSGTGVRQSQTVDLLRHQRQLIAQLFRQVRIERSLHIPVGAGGVRGIHLAIDKFRHARFQRAWTALVIRDQAGDGSLDKGEFLSGKPAGLVVARRLRRSGIGSLHRRRHAEAADDGAARRHSWRQRNGL